MEIEIGKVFCSKTRCNRTDCELHMLHSKPGTGYVVRAMAGSEYCIARKVPQAVVEIERMIMEVITYRHAICKDTTCSSCPLKGEYCDVINELCRMRGL